MDPIKDTYQYVIVGAGVAAAAAVKGIRSIDPDGDIAIFGAEPDGPLYRPDLSKTLWLKDGADLEDSTLTVDDARLSTDTTVSAIDPVAHQVTLADGTVVGYRRLLLATGSRPRTTDLAPGPRVVYYRTASDYRALREAAGPGAHVVVVGGGYIGSELAAALRANEVSVTLVMDTDLVQERMFPHGLARAVTADFEGHDVQLVHGTMAGGAVDGGTVTVRLQDGREFTGNAAVIGIGVLPRTELAEATGIVVDEQNHGIEVDGYLRTSADDVFAAGDVASYPDSRLGRRRVEHVDAAETMGEAAGRNMAGAEEVYDHTPFFWSDLFDTGYEAIGEIDARHHTVEDFTGDGYDTGVVYYLAEGAVRGVLLWNVWDSVPKARALIEETASAPVEPSTLRGRIPKE